MIVIWITIHQLPLMDVFKTQQTASFPRGANILEVFPRGRRDGAVLMLVAKIKYPLVN